jgi:hypothetical protein
MSPVLSTIARPSLLLLLAALICHRDAAEAIRIDANGSQPRVAIAGDRVAIAYAAGETLMVARSTDRGTSFSPGAKVGGIPKLMAGMRRGPQLAMTAASMVVAGVGAQDGNLVAWRSRDQGATWVGPVMVNDKPKSASEGLCSLTGGKGDTVWAVWLDGRDGVTKIELSRSSDGGKTWSPNAVLYQAPVGSVCECCQPMVAADAGGAVAVMWRNHVGGDRDMWLRSSTDDGKTFSKAVKLGSGAWPINACPMDGGGLAVAGPTVRTLWRRDSTLFACSPGDQQETKVGPGKNGALALAGDLLVQAWQNGDTLMLESGAKEATAIGPGGFPHLAAAPDGKLAMLVWQDGNEVKALRIEP